MQSRNSGFVDIEAMTKKYHMSVSEAEKICLDSNYTVSTEGSTPCIEYSNCNLNSFYWGQVRAGGLFFSSKLRENR